MGMLNRISLKSLSKSRLILLVSLVVSLSILLLVALEHIATLSFVQSSIHLVPNQGKHQRFKSQKGIASWYGPGFAGNPTANGDIYNPGGLSAAHKSLPLQSVVRVTRVKNGKSVILRINDRGPYVKGRILDLSRRAAALLGMKEKGIAEVKVEVLFYPKKRRSRGKL